jgi:uncharacterized protein (TIGR03000 family)
MSLRSLFFAAATALAAALFPVATEAAPGHGGSYGGGFHGGGWHGAWHGYHRGYWGGHGFAHYGYRPWYGGWGYGSLYYPSYGYAWYPGDLDYSWYPGYALNYDYRPTVYGSAYYTPEVTTTVTPTAPAVAPDNSVQISLVVPPDAEVWFDDSRTQQTGGTRQFHSPPLTPGRDHTYTIHARWRENGRTSDRFRTVDVQAGASLNVDMTQTQPGDRTQPS